MDDAFAGTVADWFGFYALLGGAAATLLGLLFVAVSLRLDLFRKRMLTDVRDFATVTFGSFLVAIVVAAVVTAPHARRGILAVALFLAAAVGLLMTAWVVRAWVRLNLAPRPAGDHGDAGPTQPVWVGLAYLAGMIAPYLGLLAAAALITADHRHALGMLAVSEGGLLVMGAVFAWILLSHAGGVTAADADAS